MFFFHFSLLFFFSFLYLIFSNYKGKKSDFNLKKKLIIGYWIIPHLEGEEDHSQIRDERSKKKNDSVCLGKNQLNREGNNKKYSLRGKRERERELLLQIMFIMNLIIRRKAMMIGSKVMITVLPTTIKT